MAMKPVNHTSHKEDNGQQTSPPLSTNQSDSAVLPNTFSPNQDNPDLQQSTRSEENYQQMSAQTIPSMQESSTQSNQPNQSMSNSSSQSAKPSFQNQTLHQASQTIHPSQYYLSQPCIHQPYYSQWQPTASPSPSYPYGGYYPAQPHNAKDSSMIRKNPFRKQSEEAEPEGWTGFTDKIIRTKFIRKVYVILTLQLLFTLGIIALFIYEPHVKKFVQENRYLYYVALAVFFPVYIGLICFQSVRRRFPYNIIALIIFTMAMSYMCATISTFYDTDIVLMAVGICAAVCFVVTIFSFYTKFDFTTCGSLLCILLLILILFGIIAIFFPTMVMRMIYAGLGAIVFTLMLAYNTQMMMGGKNYELSPEEYVFAAIQIYIDIIYIFLFLLMLVGSRDM